MTFQKIYDRAAARKGGENQLKELLPEVMAQDKLRKIDDSRFLAEMTKRIFQAGFAWKVIEAKWEGFETVFNGFDPDYLTFIPIEEYSQFGTDARIVRNMQKIITIRYNAEMVKKQSEEHNGFGNFIADWPCEDQIGLLLFLKKNGKRLGGATAQYFLRFIGKDSFIVSRDVALRMKQEKVIDTLTPTSQRDMKAIQAAFNDWHEETGLSYTHLSRICAMSVDS